MPSTYIATLHGTGLGAPTALRLPRSAAGETHRFLRYSLSGSANEFRVWERRPVGDSCGADYRVVGQTLPAFPNVPTESLAEIAEAAFPIDGYR